MATSATQLLKQLRGDYDESLGYTGARNSNQLLSQYFGAGGSLKDLTNGITSGSGNSIIPQDMLVKQLNNYYSTINPASLTSPAAFQTAIGNPYGLNSAYTVGLQPGSGINIPNATPAGYVPFTQNDIAQVQGMGGTVHDPSKIVTINGLTYTPRSNIYIPKGGDFLSKFGPALATAAVLGPAEFGAFGGAGAGGGLVGGASGAETAGAVGGGSIASGAGGIGASAGSAGGLVGGASGGASLAGSAAASGAASAGKSISDLFTPGNVLKAGSALASGLGAAASTPTDPAAIAAQQARDAENAREAAINKSVGDINSAFGGFNDDYYNSIADAFKQHYLPQLQQQYSDAKRQLPLEFSNTANSTYQRYLKNLERDYSQKVADENSQAQNFANQQRGNVENTRAQLVSQAQAGSGLENAATIAASQAKAASALPSFSPLGDVFAKYTADLMNTRAAANQGYTPYTPLLFNTGGGNRGGNGAVSYVR